MCTSMQNSPVTLQNIFENIYLSLFEKRPNAEFGKNSVFGHFDAKFNLR